MGVKKWVATALQRIYHRSVSDIAATFRCSNMWRLFVYIFLSTSVLFSILLLSFFLLLLLMLSSLMLSASPWSGESSFCCLLGYRTPRFLDVSARSCIRALGLDAPSLNLKCAYIRHSLDWNWSILSLTERVVCSCWSIRAAVNIVPPTRPSDSFLFHTAILFFSSPTSAFLCCAWSARVLKFVWRQRQVQIISLRIVRTGWSVSVTDPMLSSTSLTNVQKSGMRIAQCVSCILWVFSLMRTALLSITAFARQDITHTLHALHRALSQEFYLPPPTLLC